MIGSLVDPIRTLLARTFEGLKVKSTGHCAAATVTDQEFVESNLVRGFLVDYTIILKVELSVGDLIFRNDDYKVYDLLPIKLELISH